MARKKNKNRANVTLGSKAERKTDSKKERKKERQQESKKDRNI